MPCAKSDVEILAVRARRSATILLTEHVQHGFTAGGMRAVNPCAMPDRPSWAEELGIRV
jgi:predicted nucleic acid-binding protein